MTSVTNCQAAMMSYIIRKSLEYKDFVMNTNVREKIKQLAKERILIMDGAMGSIFSGYNQLARKAASRSWKSA